MKNTFASIIEAGDGGADYFDDSAHALQTRAAGHRAGRAARRLGWWLAARLQAHQDRVFRLGVYRRCRLDAAPAARVGARPAASK